MGSFRSGSEAETANSSAQAVPPPVPLLRMMVEPGGSGWTIFTGLFLNGGGSPEKRLSWGTRHPIITVASMSNPLATARRRGNRWPDGDLEPQAPGPPDREHDTGVAIGA